jgi:hypothetical protein
MSNNSKDKHLRRPIDMLMTVSIRRDWEDRDLARDSLPVEFPEPTDLSGEVAVLKRTAAKVMDLLVEDLREDQDAELSPGDAGLPPADKGLDLKAVEARQVKRDTSDAIRDTLAPYVLAQLRRVVGALLDVQPAKITHTRIREAWVEGGSSATFPHVDGTQLSHLVRQLWRTDVRAIRPMLHKHNENAVGEKGNQGTFSRVDSDIFWDERTKPAWRVTSKVAKEWRKGDPSNSKFAVDHMGRKLEAEVATHGRVAKRSQVEAERELDEASRDLDVLRFLAGEE